jgi:porin
VPRLRTALAAAGVLLASLDPAAAQAPPGAFEQEVLGLRPLALFGLRPALAERGLKIDAFVITEAFGTLDGGARRDATYLDAVDFRLTLDGKKAFGWPGLTVVADALGTHGGNPSRFVGDAQGVSEIAGPSRWRLQEGWIEQRLAGDRIGLLAGRYDLNTEFYLLPSAAVLINSSFGTGPEFSESGRSGPSLFPDTQVGGRLDVKPLPSLVLRLALFSGFGIGEIAWTSEAGKVAVGGWAYTGKFDDLSRTERNGEPIRHHGSGGVYLIAEHAIHHLDGDPARRVTVFGQLGLGDPRVSRFAAYTGGGLVVIGPWAARPSDQLALGVAAAHNGNEYLQAQRRDGLHAERSEVTLELTYRFLPVRWLFVQPDLQYVINPNTDPARRNAVVGAVRLTASF